MNKKENITTRFAVKDDGQGIFDLLMHVYNNNYPKEGFSPEMVEDKISDWVLCTFDDRIVGTAKITNKSGNGYLESLAVDPSMRRKGLGKTLESERRKLFEKSDYDVLFGSCRCIGSGIGSVKSKESSGFMCVGFQPNREIFGASKESLVIELLTKDKTQKKYAAPKSVSDLAEVVLTDNGIKREFENVNYSSQMDEVGIRYVEITSRIKRDQRNRAYYAQVSETGGYSPEEVRKHINEKGLNEADYLQVDVPMANTALLFSLEQEGFKPVSYLLNFAQGEKQREDVVEMVKLKDDFQLPDLKQMELPYKVQRVAEHVLESLRGQDNGGQKNGMYQ